MTRPRTCHYCGTTEGVAIDNTCDPCLSAKVARERAAQGLPPKITDGPTLDRIAALLEPSAGATVREAV